MDIDLSILEDRVKEIKPENVTFPQGDSHKIEKTFRPDFLRGLPHPWLVREDPMKIQMEFWSTFISSWSLEITSLLRTQLQCILVEDKLTQSTYIPGGDKLLKTLKRFLEKHHDCKVDTFFTDFFGYNGTWLHKENVRIHDQVFFGMD